VRHMDAELGAAPTGGVSLEQASSK